MVDSATIYNKALTSFLVDDEKLSLLKKANLELLDVLHSICKENEIRYSIAYGTMLGAVRHKGFIPWDDDLDVVMMRSDYNKFCKIVDEKYSSSFWVRNRNTDKKYCPLYFGKFMKKGTVLTELSTEGIPNKYGIFVDIFVLDFVPKSNLKQKLAKSKFKLGARLASLRCDFKFPSTTILKAAKNDDNVKKYYKTRRRLGAVASIMPLSFWTRLSERAVSKAKKSDMLWTGINLKQIERAEMEKLALYQFEGKEFYGFKDYDKYLKLFYGDDYMQLPPEDKRERHLIVELEV